MNQLPPVEGNIMQCKLDECDIDYMHIQILGFAHNYWHPFVSPLFLHNLNNISRNKGLCCSGSLGCLVSENLFFNNSCLSEPQNKTKKMQGKAYSCLFISASVVQKSALD